MFVQRGGTDTFLGLVAGVGLASPVEDGCIREIAGHASEWLKEHKLQKTREEKMHKKQSGKQKDS